MDNIMNEVINIARTCHNINKEYCEGHGDLTQLDFDLAPEWQQQSAIEGVIFIINNPDSSPEDVHNAWAATKLNDGWTYGEVKSEQHKTHPCLVEYDQLPLQQRIKDSLFSLVVKSFRGE